jgi:signal transduction histidine kinase
MGVFSGFVAALAVLPAALLYVVGDTTSAMRLAGDKAVMTAEFRASLGPARTSSRSFEGLDVAAVATVYLGRAVIEFGPPDLMTRVSAAPEFEALCANPGHYELLDVGEGRRWAWGCAENGDFRALAATEPRSSLTPTSLGLLLFLLVAVVGLVTALVVLRVLAPLSRVSTALVQVEAGERDVRLKPTGLAELDEIVYRVNATALAMEQREDAITSRIRTVQRMARLVAHEVRNPLQSLELLTTLMVSEDDEEARAETGLAIRKEISILDQVVTRLLRRSIGADLELNLQESKLEPILRHVHRLHQAKARESGISLELGDIPKVEATFDSALVGRSMANLVINALQHARSQVQISGSVDDGSIVIYVDDDGPGVDETLAASLFDPNVSGRAGGSGLGLALVLAVAQAHGGTATQQASPLGGARFVLRLPHRVTPASDTLPDNEGASE